MVAITGHAAVGCRLCVAAGVVEPRENMAPRGGAVYGRVSQQSSQGKVDGGLVLVERRFGGVGCSFGGGVAAKEVWLQKSAPLPRDQFLKRLLKKTCVVFGRWLEGVQRVIGR